jgi:heme/copper-type cytochrome/quinol oxidase subunit 4
VKEAEYRIIDEPRPGGLAHLAVNPFWIFLAMMLGGAWLGWPWFVLNGLAIGSASVRKELALVLVGIVAAIGATLVLLLLVSAGALSMDHVKYAMVGLIAIKLAITYFVFLNQSRSFELFSYFGGQSKNALLLVIASVFVRPYVLKGLPSFFQLVLS